MINMNMIQKHWKKDIYDRAITIQVSFLLQEIVDDFIFPASKLVVACRKSGGELPSEQAIPVCSSTQTSNAAFDLLVALCTGCVSNLRCLSDILLDMYYAGEW